MSIIRQYLPRCNVHHTLHAPCGLEQAITICEQHRQQFPAHRVMWTPIKTKERSNQ